MKGLLGTSAAIAAAFGTLCVSTTKADAKLGDASPLLIPGQEFSGDVRDGDTKVFGKQKPVVIFRIEARESQRLCIRVASPERNVHAYIFERLSRKGSPTAGTWVPFSPSDDRLDRSLLAEFPNSGERYLVIVAHDLAQGAPVYEDYRQENPYEIKIWDADQPEPPSRLPLLARDQHPASGAPAFYGELQEYLGRPLITEVGLYTTYSTDPRGNLVQVSENLDGTPLETVIFSRTNRRGEYKSPDGRLFQVQCDGALLQETSGGYSYWLDQDGELRLYSLGVWAPHKGVWNFPAVHPLQVLRTVTSENVQLAMAATPERLARDAAIERAWADVLERKRQEELAAAAAKARREASGNGGLLGALIGAGVGAAAGVAAGLDTGATMGAMMRGAAAASGTGGIAQGFAKGLAEETAKNDAMEQSMRNAANEGLARGAAEYARSQAKTSSAGGVSSGILIEDRPTNAGRSATSPDPNATAAAPTKEQYAYCWAMEPSKIIFSPVQKLTVIFPFSHGPMQNRFGAAVGSRNASCSTFDERSTAEARMNEAIRAWPGRKPVHTSVQLEP